MIPSASKALLKKQCSPFDTKCKSKLRNSAFYKRKRKIKGKPPVAGTGIGTSRNGAATPKPTAKGRDIRYTVTYPGGETRLLTETRDTSIPLREQIEKARKRALQKRAGN